MSHTPYAAAPDLDAWTAGGLRDGILALPAPDAGLFIQAGTIVAERAARGAASRADIESVLRRSMEQAVLLIQRV